MPVGLMGENRLMAVPQLAAMAVTSVMGAQRLNTQQRPELGDLEVSEWLHHEMYLQPSQ